MLTVRTAYDEARKTFRVDLAQSLAPTPGQPEKAPDGDADRARPRRSRGRRLAAGLRRREPGRIRTGVFALEGARRTLEFAGVERRPALSALRGFSAPVRVDDDLTEDDLVTLLKRDSDSFNRWQALQSLATRLLMRSVAAIRAGRAPSLDGGFIAAYGSVVEDAIAGRIDPAFAALALRCRARADLAREIGRDVDPDAIRTAREFAARRARPRACRAVSRRCTTAWSMPAPSAPTPRARAGARCATARWR